MSFDSSIISSVLQQVSYVSDVRENDRLSVSNNPISNQGLSQDDFDTYQTYSQNIQNENYQVTDSETTVVNKVSSALDLDPSNEGVQSSLTKFIDHVKGLFKHNDSQKNSSDLEALDTLIEAIRNVDDSNAKRLMYAALIRTVRASTAVFDDTAERDAVRMAVLRKIIPQYESELPSNGGEPVLTAWQRDSLRAGQGWSWSGILNGLTSVTSLFGPGAFNTLSKIKDLPKFITSIGSLLSKYPRLVGLFPWLVRTDLAIDAITATGDTLNGGGQVLQGEFDFREDLRTIRDRYDAGGWNVWDYASNLLSGALGGAVVGGTVGSVVPGAGTGVGAVVGGVLGFFNSLIHMNNTHDSSTAQVESSNLRSWLGIDIQALVGDNSDFMETFAKNLVDGETAHYASVLGSFADIDSVDVSTVPNVEVEVEVSEDETTTEEGEESDTQEDSSPASSSSIIDRGSRH